VGQTPFIQSKRDKAKRNNENRGQRAIVSNIRVICSLTRFVAMTLNSATTTRK